VASNPLGKNIAAVDNANDAPSPLISSICSITMPFFAS